MAALVMTDCPICGLNYALPVDRRKHERYCAQFQEAQAKFGAGFVMPYGERENVKSNGWNTTQDDTLPLEARVKGAEMVLQAWFARSVQANGYHLNHVDFPIYAAMLLYQQNIKTAFTSEVYKTLAARYGTRPGIPEGQSAWRRRKVAS